DLFSFSPQRALGYASLMILLAFAAIFGIVKLRQATPTPSQANLKTPDKAVPVQAPNDAVALAPNKAPEVAPVQPQSSGKREGTVARKQRPPRNLAPGATPLSAERANHPKLLPGEKSYLQTIAKLDLAIKAGNTAMRPTLQV